MAQADDKLTSKVMDNISLGDAIKEWKSCINEMSLKAVTRQNTQRQALLMNAQ